MNDVNTDELYDKHAGDEVPSTKSFSEIGIDDLIEILGTTIKRDEINKVLTFLAQLSAYTHDSQINISFNAPSSSGKSFIPLEISRLFPKDSVIKLGACSPTAFFHEQGEYDKDNNVIHVDLSRKILIFLDQPNNQLLGRLRPMLSHDEREIVAKITDKNQRGGNRTKTVVIHGFPAVIFCTAGLRIDEQEATRFLLLSPEISQEKIREGVQEKIKRESDATVYAAAVDKDPKRKLLIERIKSIRDVEVQKITISNPEEIEKRFFERANVLKLRHQRDIGRVISLTKVFALLNLWTRNHSNQSITAEEKDIYSAFALWDMICDSQELNLPPYVYNLYHDVIVPMYQSENSELVGGKKLGLSRSEILKKHHDVYGRCLPDWQLRQQIIPPLETAGLITQENDPKDKRQKLIYPTGQLTVSPKQNNSE